MSGSGPMNFTPLGFPLCVSRTLSLSYLMSELIHKPEDQSDTDNDSLVTLMLRESLLTAQLVLSGHIILLNTHNDPRG